MELNFLTTDPPSFGSIFEEVLVTVFVVVIVVVLEASCITLLLLLPSFSPEELVDISVFLTVVTFVPEPSSGSPFLLPFL